MFSMDNLLKMAGINQEQLNQLMAVQNMLQKLPKEEQTRVLTNFVNELNEAVSKTGEK